MSRILSAPQPGSAGPETEACGDDHRLAPLRPVNSRQNLVLFRKAKLLEFRENQCAIYTHFKGATAPFNEPSVDTTLLFDRVLQTCSIWKVESLNAVFNSNIHRFTPNRSNSWNYVICTILAIFQRIVKPQETMSQGRRMQT